MNVQIPDYLKKRIHARLQRAAQYVARQPQKRFTVKLADDVPRTEHTEQYRQDVAVYLEQLPPQVRNILLSYGVRFIITEQEGKDFGGEYHPDLQDEGFSFTSKKAIKLSVPFKKYPKSILDSHKKSTLSHEIGHALDDIFGVTRIIPTTIAALGATSSIICLGGVLFITSPAIVQCLVTSLLVTAISGQFLKSVPSQEYFFRKAYTSDLTRLFQFKLGKALKKKERKYKVSEKPFALVSYMQHYTHYSTPFYHSKDKTSSFAWATYRARQECFASNVDFLLWPTNKFSKYWPETSALVGQFINLLATPDELTRWKKAITDTPKRPTAGTTAPAAASKIS